MTSPEEQKAMELARNQQGVLCPACSRVNLIGVEHCKRCGAELYVACPKCGRKNPHVYSRCLNCHGRLRSQARDHRRRRRRRGRMLRRSVTFAVMLLGGLVLAYLGWVFFGKG